MKIIKVTEYGCPVDCLYENITTPTQRALLGYIVRKGFTDDYIILGALRLLREIEKADKEKTLYQLSFESQHAAEIIEYCELTRQGGFKKFAFSSYEVRRNLRLMKGD